MLQKADFILKKKKKKTHTPVKNKGGKRAPKQGKMAPEIKKENFEVKFTDHRFA
jgi:hypothetical protein